MRQLILVVLAIALPLTTAMPWDETIVDTVETQWPDGRLRERYNTVYTGGNERTFKEGPYRSWYQNGQLEYDGAYEDDMKALTWTRWDSVGRKIEQVSYLAGKKHGKEVTWRPNLKIHKFYQYRDGELHGKCILYDPYWDLANGVHRGFEAIWFYVEGALLATLKPLDSTFFHDDIFHAKTYYDSAKDVFVEKDKWDREFYVGKQVDGKKHGKWILWTPEGDKKRVDFYQNGKLLEF
ncbi:MAG: hypothetical protein OEV49_07815 [candidate division Zixibacteria bacterium]|nr:hypothetical protein [candidate division Zixibacteria bacterium]MDH3938690.1 hypothetical protein [candidate division Zixibacteria bacterium]MDH4034156.1 hypothetical protein [candidate division Zixibacteria bacterium]